MSLLSAVVSNLGRSRPYPTAGGSSALKRNLDKSDRTYFRDAFPARAFLGSGKLLRDARFEVLGIAVKRK